MTATILYRNVQMIINLLWKLKILNYCGSFWYLLYFIMKTHSRHSVIKYTQSNFGIIYVYLLNLINNDDKITIMSILVTYMQSEFGTRMYIMKFIKFSVLIRVVSASLNALDLLYHIIRIHTDERRSKFYAPEEKLGEWKNITVKIKISHIVKAGLNLK